MKQFLYIALSVVTIIVGGLVALVALGLWSMSHKGYAFPDGDLAAHLSGRWDWSSRSGRCDDSAHVISFSADRKVMTIAMPPHPPHDTGWQAIYDVVSLTPTRLRGAIRGEKRLTERGVPVVWDLVMFAPDEYHWHRSDWAGWNYTAAVFRCGENQGRSADLSRARS